MLATRCKLRWPCPSLARPTLSGPRSPCLSIRAAARCFGTTASPEAGRDERDGDGGDGPAPRRSLTYNQSRFTYRPLAYEPLPVSYVDILSRAISTPVKDATTVLKRLDRALRRRSPEPRDAPLTEDAPAQSEEAPLPLEHLLNRDPHYLATSFGQIQEGLAALSKDLSSDAVPKVYTHEFDALRAHHLGRWYATRLAFKFEYSQIRIYLNSVAFATEKARGIITHHCLTHTNRVLTDKNSALRRAIRLKRPLLEAVAHRTACELREAKQAQQWQRAWALERRLASTASLFLPSHPLPSVCHLLLNKDDKRITEISMSRMAEWNDSYQQLYVEDQHTRKEMNIVKRYWTVFNSSVHEKPWQGDAVIFGAQSPTTQDKELIVLRLDQSAPPCPLWPRVWQPIQLAEKNTSAGTTPPRASKKMKARILETPGGTGWRYKRKKKPRKDLEDEPQRDSSHGVQEA